MNTRQHHQNELHASERQRDEMTLERFGTLDPAPSECRCNGRHPRCPEHGDNAVTLRILERRIRQAEKRTM